MGISRIALSSLTTLNKSDSFLDGNPPYIPSSFYNIATANGTGSSGTITFSSIPSTYKHLQIRFIAKSTDTSGGIGYIFYKSNNATIYRHHELYGNGSTAYASNGNDGQGYLYGGLAYGNASIANIYAVGIIDILDYASTTKNKTYRIMWGQNTNSTYSGDISLGSYLEGTSAITSLTLSTDLGNFTTASSFALYGVN
jgi:hypothetical protein